MGLLEQVTSPFSQADGTIADWDMMESIYEHAFR
jgi:hypothetical protein